MMIIILHNGPYGPVQSTRVASAGTRNANAGIEAAAEMVE